MSQEALEALYNLNKHAKKYAELADENYRKGKGATAKKNSLRKKALYAVKSAALRQTHREASQVEIHEINGSDYYCLYFDGWSFHTPYDELRINEERIEDSTELEDFEKSSGKEHSDMSLKDSLLHVQEEFSLSANDFLEQDYVSYGHQSYFAGWSYLD